MKNNIQIFFRNDDVRNTLDESLVSITETFIKNNIPITHAVEPANISDNVVKYLLVIKNKYPDLIEIIQHGLNHNLEREHLKFEFGKNRTYDDQFKDIKKGKMIMDDKFGSLWSPIFSFPFGSYNSDTIKALIDLKYFGITTGISYCSIKSIFKNKIGVKLNLESLVGRNISYHEKGAHIQGIREVSVSINLIKKYLDENNAVHHKLDELTEMFSKTKRFTTKIGFLLHHRFHKDIIPEINELIHFLKSDSNNSFYKIETIYKR